jgi:hypothetical protein
MTVFFKPYVNDTVHIGNNKHFNENNEESFIVEDNNN